MASGEADLIAWLNADPSVTVEAFGNVPEVRPPSFVTVERTGGQQTTFIPRLWRFNAGLEHARKPWS